MQEAHEVVEKFIKPWLAKNHPNADIVIMAGSYGRAMKQGGYQPIASSDVDLIIIYSDLEKGGFRAAAQSFTQEDVGTALGEAKPRIMMIDTNVHDLASLHYHDKMVKDVTHFAFMNVMLDEGYVLQDKLGIAPVLQAKAGKFIAEGPSATPQGRWAPEIDRLQVYLDDIRAAKTVEEKRFLGTMALIHTCEYALGVNKFWRSGSNQAYRRLVAHFPDEAAAITQGFSDLIRHGKSDDVEVILENYIVRGKALLKTLPAKANDTPYPIEQFVSPEDQADIRNLFLKFMTDHMCEALETSQKRGELAFLENLSSSVHFIKTNIEIRDKMDVAGEGIAGMHFLAKHAPDLMPAVLNAVDEGEFEAFRRIGHESLKHMGGMHYTRLDNLYDNDLARVNATKPKTTSKRNFKPGFTP